MPLPEALKSKLKLPVIAAPMFLVSGPKLVIESCKAGIVGTFPALNERTTEGFEKWLVEIKSALGDDAAPYGVNLIVHKTNPRLKADLEMVVKHKVPVVITSLGAVKDVVDAVHSYGGLVFHDVTNVRHGQKALEAGVDGLIAVCGGAGGHAGTFNPFALVSELRQLTDKCIILAGSLSTGGDVLAARACGADLAYMGTRFIATEESMAAPEYKQMVVQAKAADITYTPAVSGIPANFMRQSLEKNGIDPKAVKDMNFGGEMAANEEAKAWKTIWSAGHGVSAINDSPKVADLVGRMKSEFQTALERSSQF